MYLIATTILNVLVAIGIMMVVRLNSQIVVAAQKLIGMVAL